MCLEDKSNKAQLRPAPNSLYESSNGDSWSLAWDPTTEARAAIHRLNPQSGGQISYISINRFLNETSNGPEHQALKQIVTKQALRAGTMLIAYDSSSIEEVNHTTNSRRRSNLSAFGGITSKRCGLCNANIRRLRYAIDWVPKLEKTTNCSLLTYPATPAKWVGVNDTGSKWLAENI